MWKMWEFKCCCCINFYLTQDLTLCQNQISYYSDNIKIKGSSIKQIIEFFIQFKNKSTDENEIVKHASTLKEFANQIKKNKEFEKYQDTFLATLGYAYRLENHAQKLYYTFSEACCSIDMAKLMRDETELEKNSIIYALIIDICIDEFMTNKIDENQKKEAIKVYKILEEQKSSENKKYHMYQY